MDAFERLSYTKCHFSHFQKCLTPAYTGVGLATALATPEAHTRLRAIVEAALLRDLEIDGVADAVTKCVMTTTKQRDRWLIPYDEAQGMLLCQAVGALTVH